MALLRNCSGRVVEVEDDRVIELVKEGFEQLRAEEVQTHKRVSHETRDAELFFYKNQVNPHGYGQSTPLLIEALEKAGIGVTHQCTDQKIGIVYSYPHALEKVTTERKVLYSMFESTRLSPSWTPYLEMADKIFVPSKFCKKAFEASGVKAKVVPLGYNSKDFFYKEKEDDGVFTFVMYNAFDMRKGWDLVFEAFQKEFKDNEKVKLILKTTAKVLPFPILPSQYPNIEVIKESLTSNQLRLLLQSADCFVFPSRGEGFGLTPLEALACGTTAIIPNASGMSEYFDKRYFIELKVKGEREPIYENFDINEVGKMIEPDVKDLAKKMRWAFNHQKECWEMGKKGSKWVAKQYPIEKTGELLAKEIRKLKPKVVKTKDNTPKNMSIVILSMDRLYCLQKCIYNIRQYTDKSYELIVVDNGSKKETVDWLKKQDDIKLILNKTNRGVARGRNQGMKIAKGEYICLLDNDIFVEQGWDHKLAGILEFMPQAGIVGVNGADVENYNPIIFRKADTTEDVVECEVVPGGLTLFNRKLLERVGYLDEDMPNPNFWHEDLGFCRRIRLSGLKVYTISNLPYIHQGGLSHVPPEEAPFGFQENARYIEHKYTEDNTLIIHRNVCDEGCSESFCVLAKNIANIMRDMGYVVVRKDSVKCEPVTFDFCKAFDMKFNGKRICLMHLENDRPPRAWLESFKPYDFALNVSPHAYHNLIKWGFPKEKMVNVSPNGVNGDIFNLDVKPLNLHPNKFKFLTAGASQPRKGTDRLIQAYFEEFTADDNTVLVIKDYRYGWAKWTKQLIQVQQDKHPNPPLVEHIFEDYPVGKLAKLYRAVALNGAYFHPHKGECFGLPIFEALACGCRVGVTNYTGPKYFLKDYATKYPDNVYLFDYELGDSTFHNWKEEPYYEKDEKPQWALASIKDCRKWARKTYNSKYNKAVANKLSKEIIKEFSWENTVSKFAKAIKNAT